MDRPFSSPVLTLELDGAIATLWLDRPEALNAMGPDFWADLPLAMAHLSQDHATRVVVVAAKGPHFSVGLDLKSMGSVLTGESSASDGSDRPGLGVPAGPPSTAARAMATRDAVLRMQAAITSVASCPKPVVVAVHGYCIGGGVDLVTACDIRLASADAVFSVRETKMAIVADLGSLQRLPHIVGGGHAAELALTGRDVDAIRAKEIGLVSDVLATHEDLLCAARSLAEEIAGLSPLAVQGTKAVLAANDGRTVAQGLDYVATWNAGMLASDDVVEAVTAFAEKRPPRFSGR